MLEENKPLFSRMSDRVTSWVGSTASIFIHTIFFAGIFGLALLGVSLERILLVLTTAVSLEAIYLAIFIQMTVNRHTASLHDVEEDIEELGEEVEELGDEVEDIGEDIDEISEDIDKIQEEDAMDDQEKRTSLDHIEGVLQRLLADIEALKKNKDS